MESSDWVVLFAATISFLGSIVVIFCGTRVAIKKERRQLRWNKELDRFFSLEELAGELVEVFGGCNTSLEECAKRLRELDLVAGRFGRYPEVRQAIRDLSNVFVLMYDARKNNEDDREVRQELDPAYRNILYACDKAKKSI